MKYDWTVLIIDDCAADRKMYRRFLTQDPHQSYTILEADYAEDGLAICAQQRCDAVVLDFCLPDMSGLQFFQRLQHQKIDYPISVVMLTGQGDEAVAVQAMKSGIQDYLVKDRLDADVLQLAIRNAVQHASLNAKLTKLEERKQLMAKTAFRIRQSLDLEEILQTTVREVSQLLQCDYVCVYQYESTQTESTQTGHVVASTGVSCPISVNGDEHPNDTHHHIVPITVANTISSCSIHWGLLIAHQCSQNRLWKPDEIEMLHDLTVHLAIAIQQAELLEQTQRALEKEKQLNTFKSEIIATISHEYRTPLASILAAATTLKQNHYSLDQPRQQRFLDIVENKARYLGKLVDDMLLVNQVDLNQMGLKPTPLNINHFFSELIDIYQHSADDYSFDVELSQDFEGFWGDPGLLRIIVDNILSNAIKYSPYGGPINISLTRDADMMRLSIQDEGIGIPTVDQSSLFQAFSRGSNVGTIPGTGLGLAITQSIVELYQGEIMLESQVDKGTKVTVLLPNLCKTMTQFPEALLVAG